MCLGSARVALRTVTHLVQQPVTNQCPAGSGGAGSIVHFCVFPLGPEASKMSNDPPPPYPGGPTAPLLEEKSGAPPTPGRVQCSLVLALSLAYPSARRWCLEQPSHEQCGWVPPSFFSLLLSIQAVPPQL